MYITYFLMECIYLLLFDFFFFIDYCFNFFFHILLQTKDKSGKYIVMEARLCQMFKNETEYEILQKYKGKELEGIRYEPIFDYFKRVSRFSVLNNFITISGSFIGVVIERLLMTGCN